MTFPSFGRPSAVRGAGAHSSALRGFSLIEVLIATSILLVIVVLVSMVFQQQSGAFKSGTDRVKGQAAIRSLVSILSRDLSMAVDAKNYDVSGGNSFGGNGLTFLAETGGASGSPLQKIVYSYSGGAVTRTVSDGSLTGDGWTFSQSARGDVLSSDSGLSSVSFTAVKSDGTAAGSGEFPAAVKIRAVSKGSGKAIAISGHSLGKDKQPGTDDDIYVGGRP